MVYPISECNDSNLLESYKNSIKELSDFFGVDSQQYKPKVFLVTDRDTIDSLKGYKTENWVVGWTNKGDVYLLDKENYETESIHKYSEDKYFSLLKHELAHCFTSVISGDNLKPIWLREGITIFLSGQNNHRNKPMTYTNYLEFYDHGGKEVYSESGFVVEKLVNKYGKDKLLNLLTSLSNHKSEDEFFKLFKDLYGFELTYTSLK